MKKEIIISESDFKILEKRGQLWDKFANTNTHIIQIYLNINDRYNYHGYRNLHVHEDIDVGQVKETLPAEFKEMLASQIKNIRSVIQSNRDYDKLSDQKSAIEDKLNKIPKWVQRIFT